MKNFSVKISSVLSILIIWYLVYIVIDHPLLMPSFLDVSKSFISMFKNGVYLVAFGHSIFRLVVSLSVSSLLGILFGFITARYDLLHEWMKPYVTIIKTIPVISAIIIMYVIFGFQIAPYAITFLMIFPLFYQATYQGIKAISKDMMDVYHLETSDWYLGLRFVYLPNIRNYLLLAFYQSFGLGFKVLVTSEFITQTKNSIGKLLYEARVNLNYDIVFALTLFLIIITLGVEWFANRYKNRLSDE
jgi:NitT/TauT family transport system permease protein